VRELERRLEEAAALLKAQPEHLARRIEVLLDQQKRLEGRLEQLLRSGEGAGGRALVQEWQTPPVPGVTLVAGTTEIEDRKQLALLIDAYRRRAARTITVLFAGDSAHVGLSDDLVGLGLSAVDVVKALSGGRGGGRAHFASGPVGRGTATPASTAEAVAGYLRSRG